MGSFIDAFENKVLDHILKGTSLAQPTNIYIELSTADPGESGGAIAPPSGNNYARAQCNTWNTAASRATANTNQVNFPQASGSWGTISHWALYDAITGGNLIAYGAFTTPKVIGAGHTPFIKAGELDVNFNTGGITTHLANKVLDHVFKVAALTQYTNLYVGVATSNPGDAGILTGEPGSGAYARQTVNAWNAAASGASANTNAITFPEATGSWGTISHGFIVDSDVEGAGNVLLYGPLGTSQAIDSGDVLEIAAGDYDVTLT